MPSATPFQPGNNANPRGRPRKHPVERKVSELIKEGVPEEAVINILNRQIQKAMSGNTDASKLVLSYRVGTPEQVVRLLGNAVPRTIEVIYSQKAKPDGTPLEGEQEPGTSTGGGDMDEIVEEQDEDEEDE